MATSLRIQTPSMIKESARQHSTSRLGYTETTPGLYTENLLHKNQQKDGKLVVSRYNWLGDKFHDPDRVIPTNFGPPPAGKPKWKAMPGEWYPGSRNECNTFGLKGQRIRSNRDGDPYPDAGVKGVRKERETTKVGFGGNAGKIKFVPEMATAAQQARFLYAISQEQKAGGKGGAPREPTEEEMAAFLTRSAELHAEASWDDTEGGGHPRQAWGMATTKTTRDGATVRIRAGEHDESEDSNAYNEFLPRHMRANTVDLGPIGSRNHEFGNAHAAQTRQERQRKSRLPRTYGGARPQSASIGEGVWAWTAAATKGGGGGGEGLHSHAKASATKKFVDRAHIGAGLPEGAGKARFTAGKPSQLYRQTQHKYN